MNIENYGYSYANKVGCLLRQPLYVVCENIHAIVPQSYIVDPLLVRIVKVALRCLIAVVCIIPASLLWLLGKGICLLGKTQINHKGLTLVPSQQLYANDILLINVQEYKEKIILEMSKSIYYRSNKEISLQKFNHNTLHMWHCELGSSLGLKDSKEKHPSGVINRIAKWAFMQKYEDVNRLVSEIHLNIKEHSENYKHYMMAATSLSNYSECETFVYKYFCTMEKGGNYVITQSAVNFMLKTIGVLK